MQTFWYNDGDLQGNNQLIKSIINKSKTARFRALIELIRSFSLKAVLKTINDGEIIPKLGTLNMI